MISIMILAAFTAASPVEAQVVEVDLRRPVGVASNWSNRIHVDLVSAEERELHLCPGDVSVVTERRVNDGFVPVDRFRAHAMSLGTASNGRASCRDIALAPGRAQRVTFTVAAVPGGRHRGEDRYTVVLDPGSSR